jgi:Xaa-Pro aminopeptidase
MFLTINCRPNALIIHYTSNDHLIRDGEMLLVDAGCEYKFVFIFAL